MPDPKNKKKPKANGKPKANTKPNDSGLVQVGVGRGSMYVRKDGVRGKEAAKAKRLMEMKEKGKKLLRSEEALIRKYFNRTKPSRKKATERTYKVKK